MSVLRTLRKLMLGDTWALPGGLAAVVAAAAFVARPLLGGAWTSLGGFVLLAGVLGVLWFAVRGGAPARPGGGRDGRPGYGRRHER